MTVSQIHLYVLFYFSRQGFFINFFSGCPVTLSVDQASLEFRDPPVCLQSAEISVGSNHHSWLSDSSQVPNLFEV